MLPEGIVGLPGESCVLLGLVQPILKMDLGTSVNRVPDRYLDDVMNTLLCNLGVLERSPGNEHQS